MAHSTKLNPDDIFKQATRHEETSKNISQQLTMLKGEIDATLAASTNAATRALSQTFDQWVESVRKSVLSHLEGMAENMRREARNQEAVDSDNMQAILNVPMDTVSFLGAS